MCLITFAYRSHPEYSFILLANRDEFYQRPTLDMAYWQDSPEILAGRDLEQGGTWLGINKHGNFATVTNYRDGRKRDNHVRSRGHLTRDYLSRRTHAQDFLHTLEAEQDTFGAFNLLLGDRHGLHYLSNRGAAAQTLSPGIYGLSNALLNSPWPKLLKVRDGLRAHMKSSNINTNHLIELMQDSGEAHDHLLPDTGISHDWERRLSACFIQSPEYGTRATTLLMQKPDGHTYVREQTYEPQGSGKVAEYQLALPPIGISQEWPVG